MEYVKMVHIKLQSNFIKRVVTLSLGFVSIVASAQIDSLFKSSDVVLVGEIKLISGWFTGDLGTDHFYVTLEVDSIYKQHAVITKWPVELHWIVSNLRCDEVPSNNCISKHEGEKKIFYLKQAHFFQGDEILDNLIRPFNSINQSILEHSSDEALIRISPFSHVNECPPSCSFCNAIELEDWNKVEKHIAKNANKEHRENWMHHRAIKWVMPDRTILSSLPSYQSVRFQFVTSKREVECIGYFQIGYYKTFATWIPNVLNTLFNAQVYRHFSRENYDTMILKTFQIDRVTSPQYLSFDRREYERQIGDTTWNDQLYVPKQLDSMLVLLASVYEGPTRLYEDYKTMPNYEQNAMNYIDSLLKYKRIYSLCIMAHHTIPQVSAHSIEALGLLGDARAIPFVLSIAEQEIYAGNLPMPDNPRDQLHKTLINVLDSLTNVKSFRGGYGYGMPANYFDLSTSLSLWRRSYIVLE